MAKIVSINVGLPSEVICDGGNSIYSAIVKRPVSGRIMLRESGFDGDDCANKRVHGGADKAVCVYSVDHYPHWEKEFARPLAFGAFGENLSVSGINEKETRIGDVFRLGEAEVQVTQPRQPCGNLGKLFNSPELPGMVRDTGFTGFYLRVLRAGWVAPGGELMLLERGSEPFTIEEANRLMHKDKFNRARLKAILMLNYLSASWRATFSNRLTGREDAD